MEVEQAAAGGADLLMECDEEEQEVWPRPPEGDKGEECIKSEECINQTQHAYCHGLLEYSRDGDV